MSSTPKTIQIFLPSGEPHGIRIAEITTRIVQVIEVPRSLLADFLAMEQSSQVGLYLLVGEEAGDDDLRVYVGQSGDLRARLAQHHQKKDFWQRALVLISRTNSLTQTHALFLEWHALQQLRQAPHAGAPGGGLHGDLRNRQHPLLHPWLPAIRSIGHNHGSCESC